MGAIATFSFATWAARFPELAPVQPPLAQMYFAEACILHDNSGNGPIQDVNTQTALLYLLTAHICWLNAPRDPTGTVAPTGSPAPTIVGRIQSANEGSVSVSAENNYPAGSPQWYQQTRYGSEYWAMTAGLRTMRYRRGPRRRFNPPSVFPYWTS